MGMLHYQRVAADTVGTTGGTYETIGSITLPNNATKLYGIIVQDENTGTRTTAESMQGKVIMKGNELCKTSAMHVLTGTGNGGQSATNIGGSFDPGSFIPIQTSSGVSPANVTVDFEYDILLTGTADNYAQVWALTSNGGIDEKVLKNRGMGLDAMNTYSTWFNTCADDEIGDATSETFDSSVTVPSYVKLITGMSVSITADAVQTAGEHFAGYLTLGGTIPDLYPMDCPMPLLGPTLGTTVDNITHQWTYTYPLHIPHLANTNDTLTVTANLAATTSGAHVVGVTFFGI